MNYCSRCLYPSNHPYGILFDNNDLCSGCIVHEEKNLINWKKKLNILEKIVSNYKKENNGKNFDCIVPVTGGSDSFYTLHVVKNILNLNPLLVNYNSHFNTKIGIRNLSKLVTTFDCDMVTSTLSPDLLKRITKLTLKKYGSIYWQVLSGLTTFPVQTAVKYKIPLIIWGVHGWSEQTGMFSHHDQVEMTQRCRREHALLGIKAEDLIDEKFKLSRRDIQPFIYPYDNEIEAIGIRGLYLSNYIRWDSKQQHEKMIKLYGYETEKQQRTFNTYEDVHCMHSAGLHDYIKFIKYGYAKVHDHATREIRLQRMTRLEGIKMVKKYLYKKPKDIKIFSKWIGMTEKKIFHQIDKFRDKNIWKYKKKKWILLDCVSNHKNDPSLKKTKLKIKEKCIFLKTKLNEQPTKSEKIYTLMGRSYYDQNNYGAIKDKPKKIKI